MRPPSACFCAWAHPSAEPPPLTTWLCAQMLRNVDAGIRIVFECKNEDGSPLAGEASSLSMKVRGLCVRMPPAWTAYVDAVFSAE